MPLDVAGRHFAIRSLSFDDFASFRRSFHALMLLSIYFLRHD